MTGVGWVGSAGAAARARLGAGRAVAIERLIVVVSMGVLLAQQLLFSVYTVDDAYISFRYARNLVRGLGLVYNPGERVEGYTNFLWTMLMAGGYALGLDLVLLAKVLGIAAGLGSLYVLYRLSTRVRNSAGAAWSRTLACLLLAANGAFATAGITGLETSLFALLVTSGAYFYVRHCLDGAAGRPASWGRLRMGDLAAICFALSAMTRPEGTVVFAFGLLVLAAGALKGSTVLVGLRWVGIYALVYLPYYLWRLSYYGHVFPNTYYAKTGAGIGQYLKGLIDLGGFAATYQAVLFPLALLVLARREARLWITYVAGLTTFFAAVTVYEGGDWIPFFRLVVPVVPLYYVVLQEALAQVGAALRETTGERVLRSRWLAWWTRRRRRWIGWLVVVGLLAATLVPSFGMYAKLQRDARGNELAHRQLAEWLTENARGPIALMDIGLIGYISDLPILDTSGLTDLHVAHAPGGLIDKRFDFSYVLSRDPEYIVLSSTTEFVVLGGVPTDFPIDRRIYEDARFRQSYRHLTTYDSGWREDGRGYFLTLFARR